ncbi:MAG: right-handed parallel beta-helix repeat-containing protein [Actinomycetota bacterium]|nr:right-handed parallel beta-helix repeat-containing protein [Actinomycetota bacterium]
MTIEVTVGSDLASIVQEAPPGARIVIEAGVYPGPLLVDAPVELVARDAARIVAPDTADATVYVSANGVALRGLDIHGGSSGIVVRETDRVTISDVSVEDAVLHAIEVVDASAIIDSVVVRDLKHPLAQAIEVRNSDGRDATVISGSTTIGGQEGIVSHVSDVVIVDNDVRSTTLRGIAVTEMSHGLVRGNTVTDARGAGLYCGDMSRCAFKDNIVSAVASAPGGRSTAGWGLVASYHAIASSQGDHLSGASGAATELMGAHIIGRSALARGAGWGTLVPGGVALLVATALLALATFGTRPLGARGPRLALPVGTRRNVILLLVLGGVLVQTFHMAEHVVQVLRVHSDGVPSRGSLVGSIADTEWVHFTYNAMVLLLFGVLFMLRPGSGRASTTAGNIVAAGFLIQSWHVVEHTAKVVQHVTTGAKVNPGLVGANFDLVWFHLTINLAVYAAAVISGVLYLRLRRDSTRVTVGSGYPVGA